MKISKKIILVLLVLLIVIQFFHAAKNASTAKSPNDIAVIYSVPPDVDTILKKHVTIVIATIQGIPGIVTFNL